MHQIIKIENVSKVEKTVAEFTIWMIGIYKIF
jgi:hypothetical protein